MIEPTATTIKIVGEIPPKKSLYKRRKGPGLYLDTKVQAMLDSIIMQMTMGWGGRPTVLSPEIDILFYFKNPSKDRDGALVSILDCLTKSCIIKDDSCRHFNGKVQILPAIIAQEEGCELSLRWWSVDELKS